MGLRHTIENQNIARHGRSGLPACPKCEALGPAPPGQLGAGTGWLSTQALAPASLHAADRRHCGCKRRGFPVSLLNQWA